jgi:DNA-binding NarL/FixJ family response regulator
LLLDKITKPRISNTNDKYFCKIDTMNESSLPSNGKQTMVIKIKIVLADDHTILREATAELVNNQADMIVVGQAGTGEATIALVNEQHPDVVIMDIAMPRLDGLEATRKILAKHPRTRVMVLSAHQDVEHVIPLLKAGATSYLPKTVGLSELLDAIRATHRGESVLPPSIASIVVDSLSGKASSSGESALTSREIEVLRLVAEGHTNEFIAQQLGLSTRTVESHLTHIYTKLNVNSRTEAALLAQRKGWLVEK